MDFTTSFPLVYSNFISFGIHNSKIFYKLSKNKIFTPLDLRIALFALIFSSFQFIIGFVLYFISPNLNQWENPINEIFNNEIYLFNLITSPILNIFGILAISIGWSLFKKAKTNKKRFLRISFFYMIGSLSFFIIFYKNYI